MFGLIMWLWDMVAVVMLDMWVVLLVKITGKSLKVKILQIYFWVI